MTRASDFDAAFRRRAAVVRRRLGLRASFTGVALGLALSIPCVAAAWYVRADAARAPLAVAGVVVGGAAALAVQRRRRLSDVEVALFLDGRLATDEVISTAVAIDEAAPAAGLVRDRATVALQNATERQARPRVLLRHHLLAPVALAGAVAVTLVPSRPAPAAVEAPPGTDVVTLEKTPELDRVIESLENAKARNEEERTRFDALAERARKLRDRAKAGAPRRELQSEMAELGDALAEESARDRSGDRRAGLEAALAALDTPELRKAKQALASGDSRAFDAETAAAATRADDAKRAAAKDALDKAAQAARAEGAEDLAHALEEQKKRFEEAEKRARGLRALSDAMKSQMPDSAKLDETRMNEHGNPEAERRLAEALEKALANMTEEERRALAEHLKQQAANGSRDGKPLSEEDARRLAELASKLETAEGLKELADQLKDAAKEQPPSADAQREEQLAAARAALAAAKGALGIGADEPGTASTGAIAKPSGGSDPAGGPGSGDREGPSNKSTSAPPTPTVAASIASARVRPSNDPNGSSQLIGVGRVPAAAGETARTQGVGALGSAAAGEIEGVSRSDVPAEYRDQVGRYFRP